MPSSLTPPAVSQPGDQRAGGLAGLGVAGAARPDEFSIRRAFARLDADRLDRVIGAWMRTRVLNGRRVIALDGKTVRGAHSRRPGKDGAPHLVAAFDHAAGTVLG